jgi:membrane associated rhomboid family serine protease
VHPLSAILALAMLVPIVAPLARKRSACLMTVVLNFIIFIVMIIADYASSGMFVRVELDLGLASSALREPVEWYRVLTAMYVHGSPLHVLMNMLILTLIGVPFEDRVGSRRWLALYLFSGIIGGLVDAGFALNSGTSHIGVGASGAIFGIMGAFAVLYPRDEIPMILGFILLNRVPVFAAVIVMGIIESLYIVAATGDNIGHLVHVASLVAGVALALPLARGVREGSAGVRMSVDLKALGAVVNTTEMSDIYERILKEDVPEVRLVWFEQFVKKAKCPECHKGLAHVPGKFFCACGFKLGYGKIR